MRARGPAVQAIDPVVDHHRGETFRAEEAERRVALARIELLQRGVDADRREVREREAMQCEQNLLPAG